jgi:hypothetical protein
MGNERAPKKIPRTVLLEAQSKLDEVIKMLEPYLVSLNSPERQALVKIETESIGFLKISHELAFEYPELFPTFMEKSIFREGYLTTHELWLLINKINKLREGIDDTELLVGNRVLDIAIAFYNTIKIAARRDIPGAKVIYEELKPALPARKRKRRKAVEDERQPELFES